MIYGMTGTRNAITPLQRLWFHGQIGAEGVEALHHGACLGADHAAHRIALQHEVQVIAHPPTDKKLAMTMQQLISPRGGVIILTDKPYHPRNRDIVNDSHHLLALPDGPERPHSGTWYTINYALGNRDSQLSGGRIIPVTICYPDGTVEHRHPDKHPEPVSGLW